MGAWVRTAAVIFAVATASYADDSPGPDYCLDAPRAFVPLACRDGARCDLDRTCDGWCIVQPFSRLSSRRYEFDGFRYPCYFDIRGFVGEPDPQVWTPLGTLFLRRSERFRDRLEATSFRVRCRPARKSCPVEPVTASVAVSGDYQVTFQSRRHAVADTPSAFRIFLDDVATAEQTLYISVQAPLAPGTYQPPYVEVRFTDASGEPRLFSTFTLRCESSLLCSAGHFDGDLAITAVEPAETAVHVVHGSLRGTFTQAAETVTLDAAF